MIKQLNPFNSSLFHFYVKNIYSIKFSKPLNLNLNLHEKQSYRFYNSLTTKNNPQNNNTPLYYNNNLNNNNNIDLSSESVENIRSRLNTCGRLSYKFNYATKKIREAAVLMPLCVVNGEPSVLFTIRSMNLKTHTGEVSFPGGKRDLTDPSLEYTALRETYEEIGVSPSQIDILGRDSTMPNIDRTIKVYPFIGFIKYPIDLNKINFSQDEVYGVFSVTIEDLLNQDKRRWKRFRDSNIMYPIFETPKEIGLEIWGLTAFILESVLRKISSTPQLRKNESIRYK